MNLLIKRSQLFIVLFYSGNFGFEADQTFDIILLVLHVFLSFTYVAIHLNLLKEMDTQNLQWLS